MLQKLLVAAAVASIGLVSFAGEAKATNYTLYLHGRTSGTPNGWDYWGHGTGGAGINAVPVNYDGSAHIWDSNPSVVSKLDAYCTNGNACYIVCHSAGCAQIGYAMAKYGTNASGQESGSPWSIIWVAAGGSAAGGSEIAGSVSSFMTGMNIDSDLGVGTMRGLYNHDILGDESWGWVSTHAGNDWSSVTNLLFSGGNDTAVAVHSSVHYRNSGSHTTAESGASYWNWNRSQFVDPMSVCVGKIFGWCSLGHSGSTGHCAVGSTFCYEGTYGGIMGKVLPYTNANAH